MSDTTASDTPEDPHADAVTASLRESIDQLLDVLDAVDVDPERRADLADDE